MEGPVTKAVVESGIVSADDLIQLQRWGLLPSGLMVPKVGLPADEVLDNIRGAVVSKEAVEIRSTDLDIVKEYLAKKEKGRLYLATDVPSITESIAVDYAKTSTGNYVVPWRDESVMDLMLEPDTYLKPRGGKRVYFADVDELFFGEEKAFMICTPAKEPTDG